MNRSITGLFALIVLLFSVLLVFTTRWSVIEAQELRDNPLNKRELLDELRIDRGPIRARGGELLARSVPAGGGTFERRYPEANLLTSHAIGYAYADLGRAGLEQARNDELTGERNEIASFVDSLRGQERRGDLVRTALDLRGQRAALDGLAGRKGSVVALEPDTGRVRVMVSTPGFDANEVRRPSTFRRLSRDEDAPLFNRATQASYPPGSTFKVVTAAAALDSGRFTPSSVVDGSSPKTISGAPLNNSGNRDFGPVTLTEALTNSVNTAWASVAERLGEDTMVDYMERFGFYAKPRIDLPRPQVAVSAPFDRSGDPLRSGLDIGRVGIGQERLQVTPLQMAMVAAAVANEGRLMRPTIADRVLDRDGRTVDELEPETEEQVMKASTARSLNRMMQQVVREGTGTAAALSGIDVAGKTGTAERDPSRNVNQPWFIAFAPARDPKIALAVTVQETIGGQGGTVAAPIAKRVFESLLGEGA